jgi:hypothetical protein
MELWKPLDIRMTLTRWLFAFAAVTQATLAAVEDPEQVFMRPPESAKPGVWWHWMGCNVTKTGITRDLEEFKKSGIGMATIFGMADVCSPWAAHIENSPTDGLIAFTDPWWEMVRHAAAEGKRLGIDVGLHNCPGYTSTGGPWITPELAMQQIFQSETRVEGGVAFQGTLPRPKIDPQGDMLFPMVNKDTGVLEKPIIPGRTNYWRDIAVLAVPQEGVISKSQVIELTSKMDASGRLEWTPPPGQWIVYRFGHTTMGALTQPNQWETMGLECDKMSERAVTFHLQHVLGKLKTHLGPLLGTGLRHILLDSYEAGKPSWTPLMPEEFVQRRGYDLKAFLPTFAHRVVGSESETKKFRSDFDRTIADLYRDRLFATMSRMLAEASLRFVCEPYGGPFHTSEVTPYVHRVMTEFWSGDKFTGGVSDGLFDAGQGKRHNILEAEAFTGGPDRSQWTETPAWLKPVGDGAFCAGINRLVLHTCPLQPWGEDIRPGMTMGQWGTHFGRTQTWWDSGRAWLAYLARCQALLQWGGRAPDEFSAEGVAVQSIHRTNNGTHVFFVAHAGSGGPALCTFAVEGLQPELWDPVLGTIRTLSDFRREDAQTVVPLEFAPAQSWFVVFRHKTAGPKQQRANFPRLKPVADLAGPWEVRFDPRWGGPEAVTFHQLDDWAKRPEPGIRYYSGKATYRKTFDWNSGSHLDLGVVNCIAQVRVNGRDLGTIWTAPWGVSVPPGLLRKRGNVLEVEVANVWANRLIGDEQEAPDCTWSPGHMGHGGYLKRFPDWFVTKQPRPSKGRYGFVTWNYFNKDAPLVASGLLGPVRLMSEDWARLAAAPAAKRDVGIQRKTSSASPAAFESDMLRTGLASHASHREEGVAHTGGGKDAGALFNGTTMNSAGGEATQDDGHTFRGYGAGSTLIIALQGPHDLTEIRTFAGHADGRASQNYTVLLALAADPAKFVKLKSATLRCDGGASELRVKAEVKDVVAVRLEFENGPLGFNVYREISIVGAPTARR